MHHIGHRNADADMRNPLRNTGQDMTLDRTHAIIASVFFAIGALCGFFLGKSMYQPTYGEKVERDTLIVRDTVPQYYPQPIEVIKTKVDYKWLTRVRTNTDTLTLHDSVLVEVPITSKHYQSKDYDAWVSGYDPSLDSIKVYREKQIITDTITRTVKDKGKHFFLDVGAGCEYQFNGKTAVPFAELGARLKLGRVGIGAYGGYAHDMKENKASPQAKVKVTYDIMSF